MTVEVIEIFLCKEMKRKYLNFQGCPEILENWKGADDFFRETAVWIWFLMDAMRLILLTMNSKWRYRSFRFLFIRKLSSKHWLYFLLYRRLDWGQLHIIFITYLTMWFILLIGKIWNDNSLNDLSIQRTYLKSHIFVFFIEFC